LTQIEIAAIFAFNSTRVPANTTKLESEKEREIVVLFKPVAVGLGAIAA
jgi:hypothetical protein